MSTAVKTPHNVAEDTWPQLRAKRMARVSGAIGGIYGRVTHNPYLGYFVHAPSARNRAAKYFMDSVTSEDLWQRQKELEHAKRRMVSSASRGVLRLHFRILKMTTSGRNVSRIAGAVLMSGGAAGWCTQPVTSSPPQTLASAPRPGPHVTNVPCDPQLSLQIVTNTNAVIGSEKGPTSRRRRSTSHIGKSVRQ